MDKDEILSRLSSYKKRSAAKYGIETLGIFGSVARNEAHTDSDLDVCITISVPNPFLLAHIKEDIEILTQRRVDIVRVRERMNPFLKQRIDRDCIYV